jgi:NADH-quinone oxidoreductase subunit L
LAITGVPLFSGYFSKEAILDAAKDGPHANLTLWTLGILGAMLTAFYMFRLIFLTFFGEPRFDEHKVHVHESPKNMTVPLILLAILAVCGGWFAAPTMVGGPNHFENFLRPVFEVGAPAAAMSENSAAVETGGGALLKSLLAPGVIVALIGFLTAWWFYIRRPELPKKLAASMHGAYTLLLNKYYVDEIYLALIVRPLLWISTNVLWHGVDEGVIDGAVNGVGRGAREIGGELRRVQSGNARSYATWVIIGAVGVTALVLGVWGMVR